MSCLPFLLQNRQREEIEQESTNEVRNMISIYRWKVLDKKNSTRSRLDSIKITHKIRDKCIKSSRMPKEYSSTKQDWYFKTNEQSKS